MAIQVSDSFNQLKIERGSKVEYYKYATIKSISPVSDSNNDFAVVINFITDDKDNPLVLKMKDISNQVTWLNTGAGVNVAIEAISDWMHTDNPSTNVTVEGWTAPLGQKPMLASIPVVVASDQSDIGVDINSPIGQLDDANSVSVTISRDQFAPELLTSMFRVSTTGLNTLPLSTRSCSFANVGANDAEVLGATLKTGETVSFDSGGFGATLVRSSGNAVNYNCLTSELLIITVSE